MVDLYQSRLSCRGERCTEPHNLAIFPKAAPSRARDRIDAMVHYGDRNCFGSRTRRYLALGRRFLSVAVALQQKNGILGVGAVKRRCRRCRGGPYRWLRL